MPAPHKKDSLPQLYSAVLSPGSPHLRLSIMLLSTIRSALGLGIGPLVLSLHGPTRANAQLSPQVVLGNTTITGMGTNLGGVEIEFFGGKT